MDIDKLAKLPIDLMRAYLKTLSKEELKKIVEICEKEEAYDE